MVFSALHWIPSTAAALLTIALVFVRGKQAHRLVAIAMAFFAATGLYGFLSSPGFNALELNWHAAHAWLGAAALLSSLAVFFYALTRKKKKMHCWPGWIAAVLAAASLALGLLLISGAANYSGTSELTNQTRVSSTLPEVEATAFNGAALDRIESQGNNAIKGTQYLDRNAYRLQVTGLVQTQLTLSYGELLQLPAYAEVAYMPCVEGWGYNAKWTGFRVTDLLDRAGLKPEAKYAVFYSSDGYSTGMPINYLRENQVLMAFGVNDLTLPADRGFPFQLVAKSKYGYKWAKWITRIDVTAEAVEGYWESRGYSDSAEVGQYPLK